MLPYMVEKQCRKRTWYTCNSKLIKYNRSSNKHSQHYQLNSFKNLEGNRWEKHLQQQFKCVNWDTQKMNCQHKPAIGKKTLSVHVKWFTCNMK
jgi:hypothetical protein